MSDQKESSSQVNSHPTLRKISRVDYTGLDSSTGRYDYKERFYSCRNTQNTEGLWSLSTSPSSTASTSPTTAVPLSVELSCSTLNYTEPSVFDTSDSSHTIIVNTMEDDTTVAKRDEEEVDTAEEDEQWEVLEDELSDFLEENSTVPLNSQDIDKYIERLEEYRRGYKRVERALKKKVSNSYYSTYYVNRLDQILYKIKDCIKEAKNSKIRLRENESKLEYNDRTLKERQMREVAKNECN